MGDQKLSISNILEPLLLGLSCIIGGEQFFILLSHTNCSIRKQSVIFFIIAIITILGFSLIDSNDVFFNGFHIIYTILLFLKLIFVRSRARSTFVVSLLIIIIGFFMSLLILLSCCFYCTSRIRLLYFIFGLFVSRFLPSFIWYFYDKSIDYQNQLHSVSTRLATLRILFCLLSILLRVFNGRLTFTYQTISESYKRFPSDWPEIMKHYGNHLYKYWLGVLLNLISSTNKYHSDKIGEYFRYISPLSTFLPFFTFLISLSMFLKSPTITVAFYYPYSAHMLSTIDILKTISHLCGSLLGITYPVSITGNSHSFYFVFLLSYTLYIAFTVILKKSALVFGLQYYYLICVLSGFVLGYIWSYCLGILINTTLTQTCINQEQRLKIIPCCGERVIDQCYCKFSAKQNPDKLDRPGQVSMLFSCSKLVCNNGTSSNGNCNGTGHGKIKRFYYSRFGCNAILLCYNCNGECQTENCSECCKQCTKDCCLKVRGIFILDTVTTSSCEDCQLTIRLEAKCNGDDTCPKCCTTGTQCCCAKDGKCCCICVKCCTPTCSKECCCIKFCRCNGGSSCSCTCDCNNNKGLGTRLFICGFGNGDKCCIKELKPNYPSNFDGYFSNFGDFDIRDITISDCCHVGLRVDLHCTRKNNFFRLSEINFPKKLEKPNKITLKSSCNICCKVSPPKCCCPYKNLVKLSLTYDGTSSSHTTSTTTCGCAGSGGSSGSCCSKPCELHIDPLCSFDKRVNEIRVKLVVTWWLSFGLVYMFTFLIMAIIRNKNKLFEFKPNVKFDDIIKKHNKHNFNSIDHLDKRITTSISKVIELEHYVEMKKKETDEMVKLFNKYLGKSDAIKLSSFISSKSNTYMSSTKNKDIKKLDKKLVLWSYCVGMIYSYVICLFFEIQKFFILWENLWVSEFVKYNKILKPDLSKMSEKSRFNFDLMSADNSEDKLNTLGLSRSSTWKDILNEMKGFSNLSTEEVKLHESHLPPDICHRLIDYVNRWDHRIHSIINWINLNETMFDWHYFLTQYHSIQSWVEQLTPYLNQAPDIKFTHKKLNEGTEIFNYIPK